MQALYLTEWRDTYLDKALQTTDLIGKIVDLGESCNAAKKQNTEKNKFYYAATQRADQSEADYIQSATGAEWDPKPMIESYHHAFSRQIEQKIRRKIEESTNIEV